jgi:Ni/Co efflux regulator RcnB
MNGRQRRRSHCFIYMNRERCASSGGVQHRAGMVASRSVMSRSNSSTGSQGEPFPRKAIPMFRKVAIALIAASMLTAPVMAQAPAPTTKPATAATSAAAVKTVKADKTALKHRKHARRHNGTHMAKHMHRNGVKHARHFNNGKGHKVAGTANKVVSTKAATRSGTN